MSELDRGAWSARGWEDGWAGEGQTLEIAGGCSLGVWGVLGGRHCQEEGGDVAQTVAGLRELLHPPLSFLSTHHLPAPHGTCLLVLLLHCSSSQAGSLQGDRGLWCSLHKAALGKCLLNE